MPEFRRLTYKTPDGAWGIEGVSLLTCPARLYGTAANLCDGRISHAVLYYDLCEELARALCELRRQYLIEGDMTGAVAGMVGSVYE